MKISYHKTLKNQGILGAKFCINLKFYLVCII